MNTTLNIGLAGLGTVGGGLVRLLSENAEEIRARSGCDFNLKAVAVRNPNRKRDLPEGVQTASPLLTASAACFLHENRRLFADIFCRKKNSAPG